jgi:iron complex transport system ATP-binding protein
VSDPVLEARSLSVARRERAILEGVDLALQAGEALAVVGPNAAGKSTLLLALAGLLRPAAGEVRLRGQPLTSYARPAVARLVALVSSEDEGAAALTVRERVALGRYPHRGPLRALDAEDEAAVEEALAWTGVAPLAGRALGTLSAGERQLAALARGLAQRPQALLLDEPAAHLDVGHELELFATLDRVRAGGVAVLAVIHDLSAAARWADRLALLDRGRLRAAGPPREVLASAACAGAFGVRIRAHHLPGEEARLWSFERAP